MKTGFSIWREPIFIGACVIAVLGVVAVYIVGGLYFKDDYEITPVKSRTTPTPVVTSPSVVEEGDSTSVPQTETEEAVPAAEETGEPIGNEVNTADSVVDSTNTVDDIIAVDELSEQSDFPEIPEGFPEDLAKAVVWKFFPNYQKGDIEHEMIYRVLIKLWNQGNHDFVNGSYETEYQRVYPLYHDVVYVEWAEQETPDGLVIYPASTLGTGRWKQTAENIFDPLPTDITFIEFEDAGIDPQTFLTDEER
jgi:hypothetical protein